MLYLPSALETPHVCNHQAPLSGRPPSEDLREEVKDATSVRIVLIPDAEAEPQDTIEDIFRRVDELRRRPGFKPVSMEEAVARIRALRDEWD